MRSRYQGQEPDRAVFRHLDDRRMAVPAAAQHARRFEDLDRRSREIHPGKPRLATRGSLRRRVMRIDLPTVDGASGVLAQIAESVLPPQTFLNAKT